MQREEIAEKVRVLIRNNQPGFEDAEIRDDTRINTDAGFDSMTFVYIMCKIEAEFDISIPATEIVPSNFNSVAAMEAMVKRLQDE